MILNVYNKKRKIEKTYETDSYALMFGTIEDVAHAIKLDEFKTGTDAEIMQAIGVFVLTSVDTVKDLMKDIFDGITDEELRRTTIEEQAAVLYEVIQFTIRQLSIFGKSKN